MTSIPLIDKLKCSFCNVCIETCPMKVFDKNDSEILVSNNKCIACKACEIHCSQNAIKIDER